MTGVLKEIACVKVLWWEKGGASGELRKVTRALRPREACVRWAGDMGRGQAMMKGLRNQALKVHWKA